MDKLTSMTIFCYVAEHASFRQAADHFSLSATMIGKHIKQLESDLNTPLINRTTRKQSLTESGRLYWHECRKILDDIANAESLLHDLQNSPRGQVKINAPITLGNYILAPILTEFLADFPNIDVEVVLDNGLVDPYRSDADFIVRIGELKDSDLVARSLGTYEMIYCASPRYLEQNSTPSTVEELQNHCCLGFHYSTLGSEQTAKLINPAINHVKPRLAANNGELLKLAAIKGLGVVLQPKILVEPDLNTGHLVQVLQTASPTPKPIHLLYKDRQLSLKNRTFADYVMRKCQEILPS